VSATGSFLFIGNIWRTLATPDGGLLAPRRSTARIAR
jgi:hypothetical protein